MRPLIDIVERPPPYRRTTTAPPRLMRDALPYDYAAIYGRDEAVSSAVDGAKTWLWRTWQAITRWTHGRT